MNFSNTRIYFSKNDNIYEIIGKVSSLKKFKLSYEVFGTFYFRYDDSDIIMICSDREDIIYLMIEELRNEKLNKLGI